MTLTTLDKIKSSSAVRIDHVDGGKFVQKRLQYLGIRCGDNIRIKRSSSLGGPILITANSSDIAIGRGLAKKIYVEIIHAE